MKRIKTKFEQAEEREENKKSERLQEREIKRKLLKRILRKAKKYSKSKDYLEYWEMYASKDTAEQAMGSSKITRLFEDIDSILFDIDFAKAFFGRKWKEKIQELATVKDRWTWLYEYVYKKPYPVFAKGLLGWLIKLFKKED